ncbi:MAG: DUF4338 domain-containing protein [Actinomycetota bacterium]|nr:DUF4338 domain-containing protein [Actinomycetota bacterium]
MPTTAVPTTAVRYCGREFTGAELASIHALTAALPNRAQIAEAVCAELGWRRPDGQLKTMSARVALNRMAADELITLPAARNSNGNGRLPRYRNAEQGELFGPEPVTAALPALGPLRLRLVTTRADSASYRDLIATHHYLGYTPMAGAQLRYLIDTEQHGIVAAAGFAASAWKCAARDTHLGWDPATRQAKLHLIVGNARFLIAPHLRVPHLASAVLGRITRRLPTDWRAAYGYAPVLIETFVETPRFTGTSYRAANWIHVGHTQGRGKLDRHHTQALPVKDVYLYPLHRSYQAILTTPA